jgi:hypothetical protein
MTPYSLVDKHRHYLRIFSPCLHSAPTMEKQVYTETSAHGVTLTPWPWTSRHYKTPTVRYDLSHNRERYLTGSVLLRASRVASTLPVSIVAKFARAIFVNNHLNTAAWNNQITFCIQQQSPPACKVHHTAMVLFTLFTSADTLFNYLHNVAHKSDH